MGMDPNYAKHYQNNAYLMSGDYNPNNQVQPSNTSPNKPQTFTMPSSNIQNQAPSAFYGSYQNFNPSNVGTPNSVSYNAMNIATSNYNPNSVAPGNNLYQNSQSSVASSQELYPDSQNSIGSTTNLFQTDSPSSDNLFQTTIASNDLFPSSEYITNNLQNSANFVNNIATSTYANMYSDLDSIDEVTAQNIIDESMYLYTDNIDDNESSTFNTAANVVDTSQNQSNINYIQNAPSVQPNIDSANRVVYSNSFPLNQSVEPIQQRVQVEEKPVVAKQETPAVNNDVSERETKPVVTEDTSSTNQSIPTTTKQEPPSDCTAQNQDTKTKVDVAKTDQEGPNNGAAPTGVKDMEKCVREGCDKIAVVDPEWEDEYCSNECCVLHCRTVFQQWVKENSASQNQSMIAT